MSDIEKEYKSVIDDVMYATIIMWHEQISFL